MTDRTTTTGAIVGLGVLALVLSGLVVVGSSGRAGAAVLGFGASPSSGPGGTVVQVSGSGCAPGITLSPAQDHVEISSTALALSTDLAVAADGSWHGSFTVPANAPALPGLVAAVCFTNGLPSLTTIYTPQTFTVTGPLLPAVPVTTPTLPTLPTTPTLPSTPTTEIAQHSTTTTIGPGRTTTPGSTTTTPGTGTGVGTPSDGGNGGGGARGGSGAGAPSGSSVSGPARGSSAASPAGAQRAATAAALENPELTSSTSRGSSGSAWILWLVLLALVIGAGVLLRWWYTREPVDARVIDPSIDAPTDASTDAS